ncbi:hypothetical protein F5Y17DRAFT_465568 [Xylariaceae sp. FL0594]|nr:hypothetical protein F5Y17DRAFT_465568 [Xylariaceae sp. FL0594]
MTDDSQPPVPPEATDEHPPASAVNTEGAEGEENEHAPPSRLESLPAELRVVILSHAPDIPTLRALCYASPVLYAQYRNNRKTILRAVLGRVLYGMLLDAHICCLAHPREFGLVRDDMEIMHFLDLYEAHHMFAFGHGDDINTISLDHLRQMAFTHMYLIQPMASIYSEWALSNFRRAIESSTKGQIPEEGTDEKTGEAKEAEIAAKNNEPVAHGELSWCEEIRVCRALYRYHTYHLIFGKNEGKREGSYESSQLNLAFCTFFDAYDLEGIACIDTFMRAKYGDIFTRVYTAISSMKRQPDGLTMKFQTILSGQKGMEIHRETLMDGIISRGLEVAWYIFKTNKIRKLILRLSRNLTMPPTEDPPLKEVFSVEVQDDARQLRMSRYGEHNFHDLCQQRREVIVFNDVDDHVLPEDGVLWPLIRPVSDPPFAWVALWGGKYSNLYGEYTPTSVKEWGYVMWDRSRWRAMGVGEDLIRDQWKTSPDVVQKIKDTFDWSPLDP